jgi:hypothetical protein
VYPVLISYPLSRILLILNTRPYQATAIGAPSPKKHASGAYQSGCCKSVDVMANRRWTHTFDNMHTGCTGSKYPTRLSTSHTCTVRISLNTWWTVLIMRTKCAQIVEYPVQPYSPCRARYSSHHMFVHLWYLSRINSLEYTDVEISCTSVSAQF